MNRATFLSTPLSARLGSETADAFYERHMSPRPWQIHDVVGGLVQGHPQGLGAVLAGHWVGSALLLS